MIDSLPQLQLILGDALIHASWQAALLSVLFGLTCLFLTGKPQARHTVGVIVNLAILGCLIGTLAWQWNRYASTIHDSSKVSFAPGLIMRAKPDVGMAPGLAVDSLNRIYYPRPPASVFTRCCEYLERFFPSVGKVAFLMQIWQVGFGLLALVHVAGLLGIRNIVRRSKPASDDDVSRWSSLAEVIGVGRDVAYRVSSDVLVPVTVCWLKPAVLVPVHIWTQFTVQQIDVMVAHELAHVRRMDYLLNQLQMLVEAIFWFHPGVWLVSWRMRADREICCDEMAIQASQSERKFYAIVLRQVAVSRQARYWRMAMAMAKGPLIERFAALADPSGRSSQRRGAAIVSLLINCLSLGLVIFALYSTQPYLRAEREIMQGTPRQKVLAVLELNENADGDCREAMIDALAAARERPLGDNPDIPVDDPRILHLIDVCQQGIDPEMVYREYLGMLPVGQYPTATKEYPPDWPFRAGLMQGKLAQLVWWYAKSLTPGDERKRAVEAALLLATVRRETTMTSAMSTIVLDRDFEAVSGLPKSTVADLRYYVSAANSAAWQSNEALWEYREMLDSNQARDISDALNRCLSCTNLNPEFSFIVTRLADKAPAGAAKTAALAWLQRRASEDEIVQRTLGTTSSRPPAIMYRADRRVVRP